MTNPTDPIKRKLCVADIFALPVAAVLGAIFLPIIFVNHILYRAWGWLAKFKVFRDD